MGNKNTTVSSPQRLNLCILQNYLIVWLDKNINEDVDDFRHSITKLREISNTVVTYTNVDECIAFINEIKDRKIFMISSGALGQTTIPIVHELSQIDTIYIFCQDKARHEKWAQQWSKIKGVFSNIQPICEAMNKAAVECDQNAISMSFVSTSDDATKKNLDQIDKSFMYTQLLKEILLTIDFQNEHFMKFINYFREQFKDNPAELKHVDKLQKEYPRHTAIWWYTYQCFLYSTLNCALRNMEIELIIHTGFFLRDLHQQITRLHPEQYPKDRQLKPFAIYRGQGLSKTDFNQLINTVGGLLSFNSFLSTSKNRQVSLDFTLKTMKNSQLVGILFQMTVDPTIQSTPFINVGNLGCYSGEAEVLFSMHSVFRIEQMQKIDGNERLWQVDLTLTGDQDPQLHALTKYIREETFPKAEGWYRLGGLLGKLGRSAHAQQVYNELLDRATDENEEAYIYHEIGVSKNNLGEYAEAVKFYEKALAINEKTLPSTHPDLATSYSNLGRVYDHMGEYSQALSFHQKALAIREKTLPSTHPDLATSYSNLGRVYDSMGEYSQALSFHQKALAIIEKTLPSNHPNLASSYNNMALVYDSMGEYSQALSFHQKALAIREKTLPSTHPDLASSYNNMALVYDSMGEYLQALSFHQKALAIREKTLPSNHPSLATSYSNLGRVYDSMGEYSQALSFHQKALAIDEKTLPSNHPSLATSYSNLGRVYDSMGEYSQALSFHQKALAIREKTLPSNHPYLAISYDNIGKVYYHMKEYDKALSFYQRAVQIGEKALPSNHPKLAWYYNDIGMVYSKIEDNSKSLFFLKLACDVGEHALHETHPHLKLYKDNFESINQKI